MSNIKITRPKFPPGYVDNPKASLSWEQIVERLTDSKNYWLCTVRKDGRPHCVPRWGVFLDEKFYYDGSPETQHAINIGINPRVSLHLESGEQALIAEGVSRPVAAPDKEIANRLSKVFTQKYEKFGYAPKPDQWDEGGLFVFSPKKILAWTVFFEDPTRFIIE